MKNTTFTQASILPKDIITAPDKFHLGVTKRYINSGK